MSVPKEESKIPTFPKKPEVMLSAEEVEKRKVSSGIDIERSIFVILRPAIRNRCFDSIVIHRSTVYRMLLRSSKKANSSINHVESTTC